MTPETIAKLEQAFAFGASDLEACSYADINQTTFYRFLNDNEAFRQRRDRLKERPTLLARQVVVNAIKSDPGLAFNYLTRKQRKEFSERIEADVTSNGESIAPQSDVLEIAQRVALELKAKKTS